MNYSQYGLGPVAGGDDSSVLISCPSPAAVVVLAADSVVSIYDRDIDSQS